ncbi:transcriptional repressor [Arcicella aquatica]|uniref:Ferric uptake regulation protein n=1 Tax=Arcicella aquatica TaxID=217141 RepID=A0ABU5QM39_9BACT|nr:transcriptional repressor [Arcicella aquatica]MEA5257799.1 transcriptional repressor [Arcicella aquatica]
MNTFFPIFQKQVSIKNQHANINMALSNLNTVKIFFKEFLDAKGYRKTHERFTILEHIYERNDHFEAEELFIAMKALNYHVSRATVYNTLEILVEAELIIKHQFGNKISSKYEKAYGRRQHDHVVCTDCQKVTEFCDPRIQNIQNMVGEFFNCEILHHSLTFYSKCKQQDCSEKLKMNVKEDRKKGE